RGSPTRAWASGGTRRPGAPAPAGPPPPRAPAMPNPAGPAGAGGDTLSAGSALGQGTHAATAPGAANGLVGRERAGRGRPGPPQRLERDGAAKGVEQAAAVAGAPGAPGAAIAGEPVAGAGGGAAVLAAVAQGRRAVAGLAAQAGGAREAEAAASTIGQVVREADGGRCREGRAAAIEDAAHGGGGPLAPRPPHA